MRKWKGLTIWGREIPAERRIQVVGRLDGTFNELEGNKQSITAISSSG